MNEDKENERASWPAWGPEFNTWFREVAEFAKLIEEAADEGWWCADMRFKYLTIRIDTRSGRFILKDENGKRVSPDEVIETISKWRARHGGAKIRGTIQTAADGS